MKDMIPEPWQMPRNGPPFCGPYDEPGDSTDDGVQCLLCDSTTAPGNAYYVLEGRNVCARCWREYQTEASNEARRIAT